MATRVNLHRFSSVRLRFPSLLHLRCYPLISSLTWSSYLGLTIVIRASSVRISYIPANGFVDDGNHEQATALHDTILDNFAPSAS